MPHGRRRSAYDGPMKLAYLNPVGVIGGAERVLLAAIRAVTPRLPAFQPHVILFADGPLRLDAEKLGAAVHVVPLPARLAGLGDTQLRGAGRGAALARLGWTAVTAAPGGWDFLRRLRATLRRVAPDLIHSNGLKAHALASIARPSGVPVVWHLHDFASDRPVMARVLNRLRRGVRTCIAISAAVGRDAEATFPGLRTAVVRNAVDTDHFTPNGPTADLDHLAGLPPAEPGTVRIGLVATYANWKGHGAFLDALGRLSGAIRGYVVGGPIYATAGSQVTREELDQRASANGLNGRVGFVPFQRDPVGVYRALDVVVHASTRPEPFGLTIAEAMSCGRAVVAAAAGGAVELFTPNVDALGHAPGDVSGLTGALAQLVGNAELRTRVGAKARETAVERFGLARYGRELAAVYQSLKPVGSAGAP